jgi:hypothetical protein
MIGFAQQQDTSEISIEGIWEGKLKVPGSELRIVFKISRLWTARTREQLTSPWKKLSLKITLYVSN